MLQVARGVAEIVRIHMKVAENEQRLQDVLNILQEAVWDWHVPSGRVRHNLQWHELLGFQPGEIAETMDAFVALIHPDDRPAVWLRMEAVRNGETGAYQSEHRMVGQSSTIWVGTAVAWLNVTNKAIQSVWSAVLPISPPITRRNFSCNTTAITLMNW